jgi:CBS domain-containing protein
MGDVLEKFAKGVHRVPVIENDKVVFMLTQMTLLRAVDEQVREQLRDTYQKTVQELGIGIQDKKALISVSEESPAIDAFKVRLQLAKLTIRTFLMKVSVQLELLISLEN